ncbi:hypothetical protein MSB04_08380, partial [bacterium]|nr:hypothetical protein [bacterium]
MKKRGMKKRVLAALMTACMVVGSVPGVSLADVSGEPSGMLTPAAKKYNFDGTVSTATDPDIELNKTAVYNAETNDYTITLSAKAKEKVETKKTHVVFLLDASGSMNWCTDNSVQQTNYGKLSEHYHYLAGSHGAGFQWRDSAVNGCTLIDRNNGKTKSRWKIATDAIQTMKTQIGTDGITYNFVYFSDQPDDSTATIPYSDHTTIEGGTYLTAGVNYALSKFEEDSDDTDKVLIIVADGETDDKELVWIKDGWLGHYELQTYYPKKELENFQSATNNGKVYTVGFTFSSEGFKSLANGSGYNFNATDEDSLNVALNQISQKIKTGITDPLGNNVELVGDITVGGSDAAAKYDSEKNEITWNDPNGLDENGVSLTYRVKVKDTLNVGNVYLNGDAVLSYTVGSENHTVQFPKPSITGATLTVNYVDENGNSVQDPVTEWVGFTGEKAFKTTIPQTNDEITIGTENYRVTNVESADFAMPSLMVHPLMATEGKAYNVTIHLTKVETQPTIYKVTYDANGGAWDRFFSKNGYNLNATGNADKLTKENARGEETLEILSGNDLPTRENYDFDGWYLDGHKLTSEMTVAAAAGTRNEVVVEAHWTENKPEVPSKPKDTEIVPTVIVECRNASNSGHEAKQYYVNIPNSYEIGEVRLDGEKYVSTVTVFGVYYAEKYNKDVKYAHVLTTVNDVKYNLTWNADTKKWEAPALTEIQTIQVNCAGDKPEVPRKPVDTEIVPAVIVECLNASKSGHQAKQYDLNIPNSYEIGEVRSVNGKYVSTVTVISAYYAMQYNADVHYDHAVTVENITYDLTWDADTETWKAPALTEIPTIKVNCAGDKPEVPRKPVDTEIVPAVIVECLNASKSGHQAKQYDLNIPNSYEIGEVRSVNGKYVSTVKVISAYYAMQYNADVDYDHAVTVEDITYDLTWNPVTKKWEAPALTKIPTIKVDCSKDTPIPTDPELPGFRELKDLIEGVVLVHTGSNAAAHPDEEYALMEDGYEISWYGTTKAILTVKAAPYVNEYIAAHGNHDVKGAASAKLILARTDGGWDIKEGTTPIRFFVKCTENNPEKPALPEYDDLKKLFGETINVTCETDEQHAPQSFGLMAGTYSVTRDKENDNEAVVTVFAKDYIKAYGDGKHTNAGDDAATVKLFYDEEDGKWYSENQEIVINFKAKCEKTPETPEKQYTEIKFVVVNGTFTENGQTELTKTFEVGTKLTLADIPAS